MGLFSGVGKIINKITGADDSQKKQIKANTASQNLSFEQQKQLDKLSYAEQEKLLKMQQAYDTQMSNTAVKRQMNDYLASGINPAMIVAGGGAGGGSVSAPSTSAGTTSAPSASAPTAGMSITDIANSAISAYDAYKRGQTGDTQGDLNIAMANKADIESAKGLKELPYVDKKEKAQYNNMVADTINKRANTALQIENTKRTQEGWGANVLGTKTKNAGYKALGSALLGALPLGKAYNAGKNIYKAKKFGKFLKGL